MYFSYWQSHFAPAFFFLSKPRRRALQILYAVCRVLDDAVDKKNKAPVNFLLAWKEAFIQKNPDILIPFHYEALAKDFMAIAEEFRIPLWIFDDFLEKGVKVDLLDKEFVTQAETEDYCYGVAGTVGLACLPIFGVPLEEGRQFAVQLGTAVQWVNLIRDVGTDAKMGRCYFPQDHLAYFGLSKQSILEGKAGDPFFELMIYEAGLAKTFFGKAQNLLPKAWWKELLPARLMGGIYWRLLKKIEKQGFPTIEKKVKLSFAEKGLAVFNELRTKQ